MSLQEPYEPTGLRHPESVVDTLMPAYADIPHQYRIGSDNQWVRLQTEWFFNGLSASRLRVGAGIDREAAIRHLSTIQGSYEPAHEHKVAAVAFLMSRWFDWIEEDEDG